MNFMFKHLFERDIWSCVSQKRYRQRIEKASSKQLMKWAEKVLDCHFLEDVFNSVMA